MNNTVAWLLSLLAFAGIGSPRSFAQWVTLTAKTSESRTLTKPDGSQTQLLVEGYLYRTSGGDQLEHFKLTQDGKVIEESASLLDNRKMRVYKINYLARTVQEVKKFDTPRFPGSSDVLP